MEGSWEGGSPVIWEETRNSPLELLARLQDPSETQVEPRTRPSQSSLQPGGGGISASVWQLLGDGDKPRR